MLMRSCNKDRGNMEQEVKKTKIKKLNTQQLFGDGKEILIEHLGESYLLSITKQKKLLLTKCKYQFRL